MNYQTKQYQLSPAAGKRLIAKALIHIPEIADALTERTVVVIAGITNGYVAEEFLTKLNQTEGFSRKRFFRGITLPPQYQVTEAGRFEEDKFPGDVVIVKGVWEKGKTIMDVADSLRQGDVIIKGANAVNLEARQAAIYIGHPAGGTIIPTLQCVIGRRVGLYLPIGLEKRISGDINKIAEMLNSSNASGLRYLPVNGNIITELEAIKIITGATAELVAGGGVSGAEGSYWIAVTGNEEQLNQADLLLKAIKQEPNFVL